jgi:hypothetical protein
MYYGQNNLKIIWSTKKSLEKFHGQKGNATVKFKKFKSWTYIMNLKRKINTYGLNSEILQVS